MKALALYAVAAVAALLLFVFGVIAWRDRSALTVLQGVISGVVAIQAARLAARGGARPAAVRHSPQAQRSYKLGLAVGFVLSWVLAVCAWQAFK